MKHVFLVNRGRSNPTAKILVLLIDYVRDQVRNKGRFLRYDYEKLKNEIYKFLNNPSKVSTEELMNWAKECHTNVSIHSFDSTYKDFLSFTNTITKTNITLVYYVKDHHCFPITEEKLKLTASTNQGGCSNLLKHMSDLKWSRRHENIQEIEGVIKLIIIAKIIISSFSSQISKMPFAINHYIAQPNCYGEYLHWNNNGILDGFIDHGNNMVMLNDEYELRKSICKNLLIVYKTDDFIWSNQSFTILAKSLFKQMCRFLPMKK